MLSHWPGNKKNSSENDKKISSFILPGPEVINLLEYSLKLKIKRNDWLLVDTCTDTCPQAANHSGLF